MLGKRKPHQLSLPNPPLNGSLVIGPGITLTGDESGKGGIRIEGTVDGEIAVQGLVALGKRKSELPDFAG